jgi:hypothetical protein
LPEDGEVLVVAVVTLTVGLVFISRLAAVAVACSALLIGIASPYEA